MRIWARCLMGTAAVMIAAAVAAPARPAEAANGVYSGMLRGRTKAGIRTIAPSGPTTLTSLHAANRRNGHQATDRVILRVPKRGGKRLDAVLPDGTASRRLYSETLSKVTGHHYYLVSADQADSVLAALAVDTGVKTFPNIVKHLDRTLPDDPQFADQWCHRNPNTTTADMGSPRAWDTTTGAQSVVVALIDSGVDYTHPDLAANIWTNPGEIAGNGIDDDGNGYVDDIHGIDSGNQDCDPMDYDGHGTHVAGIMGAVGDNGLGVCGVNWQVQIMVLKGFDEEQDVMDTAMEIEAIDYLLDMKLNRGVHIVAVNASYGYTGGEDTLEKEAIEALGQAGILFMAAAGNSADDNDADGQNTHYPSSYDLDNVVSVAAADADGLLADFSSYGAVSVDLAAPGDTILSTVKRDHAYTPAAGDLFFDEMESGTSGWDPEGTWQNTSEQSNSPANAWSDSPGGRYETYADMALTGPVIDLSFATSPLAMGFFINYEIEAPGYSSFFDSLQVWFLGPGDPDPVWEKIGALAGNSGGKWEICSAMIPQRFFWEGFRFRFVLHSDYSIQKDGVYIDDVGIGVPEMIYPYAYYSGTSMATPQVTGAAALVAAAFPDMKPGGIKSRLLAGTVPLTDLEGTVATGGLLNLAGALSDPASDIDADEVPDFRDNCPATANNEQAYTDGDGYGNGCDCDLNNDDTVNQADFVQFRGYWGSSEPLADFDGNGEVNQADLMILRSRWGAAAPFE